MYTIVGNWKMNPKNTKEAISLYLKISKSFKYNEKVSIVICPPSLFLPELTKSKRKNINIGVQDADNEDFGAFTGLNSINMVSFYYPDYAIVGHSEIRSRGEDDIKINQKVLKYLSKNIKPIICVGEKERDSNGNYLRVITKQIEESLIGVPKNKLNKIHIAYEPVWAIGKNAIREATKEECLEVSIHIKRVLTDMFGIQYANKIQILYGGSVNSKEAIDFIEKGGVSGLLIGRVSLSQNDFVKIIKDVINYAKNK